MLPKKRRLNTALFKKVINIGKSFHTQFFIIRIVKDKSLLRFAVSVPKKIAKTAVLRNKIKRRIYTAIASFTEILPIKSEIIFIAKKGIEKLNTNDMKPYIKEIFVNLGLLK